MNKAFTDSLKVRCWGCTYLRTPAYAGHYEKKDMVGRCGYWSSKPIRPDEEKVCTAKKEKEKEKDSEMI